MYLQTVRGLGFKPHKINQMGSILQIENEPKFRGLTCQQKTPKVFPSESLPVLFSYKYRQEWPSRQITKAQFFPN